jgi:2-iminobutanoate/2-iminopropanoate deaminase
MNRGNLMLATGLVLALALSGYFLLRAQTERLEGPPEAGPARLGRTVVSPAGAAAPIAPYSPGIRAGDFVFLSGQIGLDPATGAMAAGGVVAETRQVLANIRTLLEAAGTGFDDVVQATVYLADLDDYARFNEEYAKVFTGPPPARVAVQVARLPREGRVEIAMTAYAPLR